MTIARNEGFDSFLDPSNPRFLTRDVSYCADRLQREGTVEDASVSQEVKLRRVVSADGSAWLAEDIAMQGKRFVWSVWLALSLSGCAGTSQNLASRSTGQARPSLRLLAWRDHPTASQGFAGKQEASSPTIAPREDKEGQTVVAATPGTNSGEPSTISGRLFSRSSRVLGRRSDKSQAKAELVRPAGNDVWADWARMNAQAKAQGARNRVAPDRVNDTPKNAMAEARRPRTDTEDTVLPVALEVGTEATGRPRLVSPPTTPRPRADSPGVTDTDALPATLPDVIEPEDGDGIRRTSMQRSDLSLADQPPRPDQPTPSTAPAPRTAPPPRTKPSTPPETAPKPTTAPETEPKPTTAPEPTTPPAQVEPAPAPASTEASPKPNANVEPAVTPAPVEPVAESPAPVEPAAAPAPDSEAVVAPSAQIAAAPAAQSKIKPAVAPAAPSKVLPAVAKKPSVQAAVAPKAAPAPTTPKLPSKTLPAAVLAHAAPAGVSPSPQENPGPIRKPSLLVRFHQWKHAMTGTQVFAAPAPPNVSPSGEAQENVVYTYVGGYMTSTPLYPAAYYMNPEADALRRYLPPKVLAGPTDSQVATASTTATVPAASRASAPPAVVGQWSAAVPRPSATGSAAKGPRTSLLSRFSSWARGDEIEVDRHPLNCNCGDHPRGMMVPPAPAPMSATALPIRPLTPGLRSASVSIPAEAGDFPKGGERVNRVATDRLDEAPQR